MKFKLKYFKLKKIVKILKKSIVFVCYKISSKNNVKLKKELSNYNIEPIQLNNNLVKRVFDTSILRNIKPIVQGSVIFLNQTTNKSFKIKSKNFNKNLLFISFKINNKIYSFYQIKHLNNFIFVKSIKSFNTILECLFKNLFEIM